MNIKKSFLLKKTPVEDLPGSAADGECHDSHRGAHARPLSFPRRPAAGRRPGLARRTGRLVRRTAPPPRDPDGLRALGGGPAGPRRHGDGPAGLRLLGLPRALLPGAVRRPGRPRAGGERTQAAARRRYAGPGHPGPRARPRGVRPARGDVPGRRRPRTPDLHADPGPAEAHGHRAQARAAAGRGRADRRQRLLHPQPGRPAAPGRRRPRLVGGVRRLGEPGAPGAGHRRAAGLRAQVPGRPRLRPTRAPSTSRRSS